MGRPRPTCATIPPVNPLDLVAIVLVVLAVLLGYRSGALPQVGGLLGAIGGGAIVVLTLPLLVEPLDGVPADLRPYAVLTVLLLAVGIGESVGSTLGRMMAGALGTGVLSAADRVAGGFTGAAQALLIVWLAGGLLAIGPIPRLTEAAQTSTADPDAERRPAATGRDRDGARVAPGRVRSARGLRRPGATAPAARRPADRRHRPEDRGARRSQHGPGLGRDVRIRVLGERGRRRRRLRRHERARRGRRTPPGHPGDRHRREGGRHRRPVRSRVGRRGPACTGPAGGAAAVCGDRSHPPCGRRRPRVSGRWQPHDRACRRDRRLSPRPAATSTTRRP